MSESATKKLRAEVAHLRERIDVHRDMELKLLYDIIELKKQKQRLGVLAIKHCPKDHHDWDELVELTEGLFDTTDGADAHAT
jgi:hypothetical protein